MTNEEIKNMVDEAGRLDEQIKSLTKERDKLTKKLKKEAKISDVSVLIGNIFKYVLSDVETIDIEPTDLLDVCGFDKFIQLVKVKIQEARKRLGEDVVSNIGIVEVKKKHKGSFKKLESEDS